MERGEGVRYPELLLCVCMCVCVRACVFDTVRDCRTTVEETHR